MDYSFSGVNAETLAIAAVDSMQFGHALDRILREILLSDPALGPVQMLKVDISDGFYRVNMNIEDIPKLGVAFPTEPGQEKLVAFPFKVTRYVGIVCEQASNYYCNDIYLKYNYMVHTTYKRVEGDER